MNLFTNNAICALAGSVSASDMTIFIDPARASLFPQPTKPDDFFLVTLELDDFSVREIIKIKDRVGNRLVVEERGHEGTTPRSWDPAHTICDHRITAGTLRSFLPHDRQTDIHIIPTAVEDVDIAYLQDTSLGHALKWQIIVNCPAEGKVQTFELFALVKDDFTPVRWTKSSILGDALNVSINISIAGTAVTLKFQNLEASSISVDFIRVTI